MTFSTLEDLVGYLQSKLASEDIRENEYSLRQLEEEYARLTKLRIPHTQGDPDRGSSMAVEEALELEQKRSFELQKQVERLVDMLEHIVEI